MLSVGEIIGWSDFILFIIQGGNFMNLDFTYQNPTTIYFGKTALDNLSSEIGQVHNYV